MIFRLMRHHPLLNGVPKLFAIVMVTGSLSGNILAFRLLSKGPEARYDGESLLWFQAVLFLTVAMGLLFRGGHLRSSQFNMGLPLRARTLWRSHYLTLLLAMLGLLLFQGLMVAALIKLMSSLMDRTFFPWGTLVLSLKNPALLLIFVAAMVGSFHPQIVDLTETRNWKRFRWGVLGVGLLMLVVLEYSPVWLGLAPVLLGAALARRACQSLPEALDFGEGLDNHQQSSSQVGWEELRTATTLYNPRRQSVSLGALNQLFKVPYPFVGLIALTPAFFTALMGGLSVFGNSTYQEWYRLNNSSLVIYLFMALVGEFIQRIHKIDALPIDRRLLLRHLVVPMLAGALLGYVGARVWIEVRDIPEERINFQDRYGKYGVAVSPSFNLMAVRDSEIEVTAPWGESHVAVARDHLGLVGLPWAVQSPYLTDGGTTSREFLAWQFSRAVQDVYGRWIEPEELDARYFQEDDEGKVFVPKRGFTVASDYGLKPRSGGPTAALILGPVYTGWFLVMGFLFWLHREIRTIKWARIAWGTIMSVLFLGHFLQNFGHVYFWSNWGGAVLVFASARMLGEMGAVGYVLAYGVWLVLMILSWRFCSRMFLKMEAPRN